MKQFPKHIVISHVYSRDNKGDAALTSVLIKDMRRVFPKVELTILALQPSTDHPYFEAVPEQPSFMGYVLTNNYHPVYKLIRAFYMVSITLLWALWYRATGRQAWLPKELKKVAHYYAQADLIVPVGGGYIRSRPGLINRLNIPLLLHPLLFSYLLGKPTVLYSQTMGPFQQNLEKKMAAFVLNRMTLILLREDKSVALLRSMGVTHNVKRSIDSGFLLESNHQTDLRKTYKIPASRLLIGVTVRSWLTGKAQTIYEKSVAEALDDVVKTSQAHVVFIPQVTASKGDDDRIASKRVLSYMSMQAHTTLITDMPDHLEIKALYDNLDLLLGTRFHSVIFSLTSHVPVVAIEYEHKTSGIMKDLDLSEWVIKIEHITAKKLKVLLHKLVKNQSIYREHLQNALPPYIDKALQTADMVAEMYTAKNL